MAPPTRGQTEPDEQRPANVKTGWNLGALPVVAFDTDLGFQYGGLVNLFYYGDGSTFPDYKHSLYFEVSRYTKGSGINRFFYDSRHFIPGIRFTTDLSLLTDKAYDFFGFNGYESVFNADWINDEHPTDYRSRVFYKYNRRKFRWTVTMQGDLPVERFGWAAGFGLFDYRVGPVDIAEMNEGQDPADTLPDIPGLYDHYVSWGLIAPGEAEGDLFGTLQAGLVYDTRDNEPNPMRGMWTELVANYAPSFLGIGPEFDHLKLSLTHRQYFTLVRDRLSFAYRLSYQAVFGRCPFYLLPSINTLILRGSTNEGLGGGRSLRGVVRNRVLGNDIAFANLELRWKFVKFRAINQSFYLSFNTFMDAGGVVRPIEMDKSRVANLPAGTTMEDFFSPDTGGLHTSLGAGLRIVMNYNFIIAVDHGRALDRRDGESGTYIGLNFLF